MALYVGTSGWAYKEWRPGFYPDELPAARFLEHYGKLLSACEINATFYRLQSQETVERWAQATPGGFRFTAKAHRRLTHGKRLGGDDPGFLEAFLRQVGFFGDRLGAVLFQLPPYRRRDDEALAELLEALPEGRYAFEFRHDSWHDPRVTQSLAQAGATVCLSNTDGSVPAALPPGPFAYVRLRADRYSDDARACWAELLARNGEQRDVFCFAKHEGIPAGDPYGGVGLAQWLAARRG
jgi:uncharacterized protein YecE (DUF72 family)